MPVTPSGLPAWTRTSDHTVYGGDVNKRNFQSQGAIDPTTDVTAEQLTRAAADLAAVTRTASFATVTFLTDDSTPADPTVGSALLMTGAQTTSYDGGSPPSGFPSVERQGAGHVRLTFAASYADPYGVSAAFDIAQHKGSSHSTSDVRVTTTRVSATVLDVRIHGGGNSERVTVQVWT